jgi:hypothetical protein
MAHNTTSLRTAPHSQHDLREGDLTLTPSVSSKQGADSEDLTASCTLKRLVDCIERSWSDDDNVGQYDELPRLVDLLTTSEIGQAVLACAEATDTDNAGVIHYRELLNG